MIEKVRRKIVEWKANPAKFVMDAFGAEPSWQQKELLDAVAEGTHPGIAIRSGHGVGKSTVLSWTLAWFLLTRPGAKILATAPTRRQLKDILWAEVSMWLHKAIPVVRDMLTIYSETIKVQDRNDWWARAVAVNTAASPEEQAETLAGYHHKHFMALIDEASGVPDPVFNPVEGFLTQEDNFVIMTGNPTRTSGYFWRVFNDEAFGLGWLKLHWNSEESPLVSEDYCARMALKYGKDSDTYRIRVLGEFPQVGTQSLIPIEWIRACVDPDVCEEKVAEDNAPVFWGLDVALEGADKTALVRRSGNNIYQIDTLDKGDTIKTSNWFLDLYHSAKLKPKFVFVDVTGGAGKGPADIIRRSLPAGVVVDVNVSSSAFQPEYYYRLRDELWWRVRTGFEFRQWRIPNNERFIRQLANVDFTRLENSGKIKIESKQSMRSRHAASPDEGDAFCLTNYYSGAPSVFGEVNRRPRRKRITNWKVA